MQRHYSNQLNMAIGGMRAQRAQRQAQQHEIEAHIILKAVKKAVKKAVNKAFFEYMVIVCGLLLLGYIIYQMTQQQQKLEQLEKQQQQKFNEVEEKMSEMSSSFTFRLFTIPFGLLMLILCLFHMMRNIKIENAHRERAQQQVNEQMAGRMDGIERNLEAERAEQRAREQQQQGEQRTPPPEDDNTLGKIFDILVGAARIAGGIAMAFA